MEKKYEIPTDEPMMVSEAEVAYTYTRENAHIQISSFHDRGTLSSAITGNELKKRLHESLKSRF